MAFKRIKIFKSPQKDTECKSNNMDDKQEETNVMNPRMGCLPRKGT